MLKIFFFPEIKCLIVAFSWGVDRLPSNVWEKMFLYEVWRDVTAVYRKQAFQECVITDLEDRVLRPKVEA